MSPPLYQRLVDTLMNEFGYDYDATPDIIEKFDLMFDPGNIELVPKGPFNDDQFATGGRVGFSEGSGPDMDRVLELEEQGFSYEEAFEIAMKELMNRDYNANGGRIGLANGGMEGIMGAMQAPGVPAGMELDYRSSGGFIPMGGPEKADDVPAMLSKNEFVMTADAVRGLGNGDIESGAQQMYDLMNNLEAQA